MRNMHGFEESAFGGVLEVIYSGLSALGTVMSKYSHRLDFSRACHLLVLLALVTGGAGAACRLGGGFSTLN